MDKGKSWRLFLLWLAFAAVILWACLSVAGAFLGADRARDMFNSPALAMFWLVFFCLLLAALVLLPGMLLRPGSLLMHLGTMVILGGAMWGSEKGHEVAREKLGIDKPREGYMLLFPGQVSGELCSQDGRHIVGQLPFEVQNKGFGVEYYPSGPWSLVLGFPVPAARDQEQWRMMPIAWKVGQEFRLPGTNIYGKVLEYLPAAAPVYANAASQPASARADANSDRAAMKLALWRGSQPPVETWLIPTKDPDKTGLTLEDLVGPAMGEGGACIGLFRPHRDTKAYKTDTAVRAGSQEMLRQTIEVNHPLHFGGYHVYQMPIYQKGQRFTILRAVSDNGLYAVFAGFAMVMAGLVWQCWIVPVAGHFRRRRHGH